MSDARRPIVKPPFDGQAGKCCWCGAALTGRRTRWCGMPCVEAYQIAKGDQGRARAVLFKRDGGKCALCGTVGRAWEADHIVPIAEGGALAIENLRTLCLKCHQVETNKLRARMATRRRMTRPAPLFDGAAP